MLTRNGKAPIVVANGASIPSIGFGTWQLRGDVAREAVAAAYQAGYRHFDTAQIYENESEVGEGLRAAGASRSDYFLTTKIWIDNCRPGDLERSAEESVAKLGVDKVDLLLLHWPNPDVPLADTIRALNRAREAGLTQHIGVSNFPTRELARAIDASSAKLVTNQVEYHPFLDQHVVMEALEVAGLALTAYSPIARGRAEDDPTIAAVAEAHGKTASQVALRWLIQQERVIAIPRSSKPERIRANFDIFDFELSGGEMTRISSLRSREGRLTSPSFAPDWD